MESMPKKLPYVTCGGVLVFQVRILVMEGWARMCVLTVLGNWSNSWERNLCSGICAPCQEVMCGMWGMAS